MGKPRHKKIMKIINYNQSGFKIEGDKLILSKGKIKALFHRPLEGEAKRVIIKKFLQMPLKYQWFTWLGITHAFHVDCLKLIN